MTQVLLYFGEAPQKETQVTSILTSMHLSFRVLQDQDLTTTVGNLFQELNESEKDGQVQHFPMDLMILDQVSDEEILAFNTACKAQHCEMKQKAMLTKHNQHWKLCDLLKEIQKEHTYFQYADGIQQILKNSQQLIIEDYTKQSWHTYETAFYRAYEQLQHESTLEEIIDAYESLANALQQLQKQETEA